MNNRIPTKVPPRVPQKAEGGNLDNTPPSNVIDFMKYGITEGNSPWSQQEFMNAFEAAEIDAKDLMNISVVVNGKVFKANLIDELKIDKDDLNTCFVEQPGKYAWWAVLAQMSLSKTDLAKAEVERLEGDLDRDMRDIILTGGEKPTEDMVKRRIKNHPDYVQANKYYLDCKRVSDILDIARRSFDHRKESLISIGANQRSEGENAEIKILKMKERAKEVTSRKDQ